MSYRIRSHEALAEALARIQEEQRQAALAALEGAAEPEAIDTAIHEARKCFKKLRAVLRLGRGHMRQGYGEWNDFYRNLGRALAPFRDAKALIETVDGLEAVAGDKIRKAVFDQLRGELERDRWACCGDGYQLAADALQEVERRLRGDESAPAPWHLREEDPARLAAALGRSYRRGRQAFQVCRAGGAQGAEFHEWRKRAKYLRYELRLVQDSWSGPVKAHRQEAKRLSKFLGDEHDLTVLRQKIATDSTRFGSTEGLQALLGVIQGRQEILRLHALRLGAKFYAEKPGALERRLAVYWRSWREQSAWEVERQALQKSM